MDIKGLAERFGTATQSCRTWVANELTLDEMRSLLGPLEALEIAWPSGAAGRGGNRAQLSAEVAMKVRRVVESQMSGLERKRARMFA